MRPTKPGLGPPTAGRGTTSSAPDVLFSERTVLHREGVGHEFVYLWQRSGLVLVQYTGPAYRDAHPLGVAQTRTQALDLIRKHQDKVHEEV